MPLLSNAALQIIDSVAIVLGQSYQLARARLASSGSAVLDMLTQRDHYKTELELWCRECDILRGQRENVDPQKRPSYSSEQRLAIIQLMRLRGWNATQTARRFVLHPNTVRSWLKAIEGSSGNTSLFGDLPWNKIDDMVRWAVHELRRLFPEREFGSRTIARHLVRAGIQMSRSTVQRILREKEWKRPARLPLNPPAGVTPHHLLDPGNPNQVWQLDLMQLKVVGLRFHIAALLDGFSRKLLALKVYSGAATTQFMVDLVKEAVGECGRPRFLITDHGCQFRNDFKTKIEKTGITHVRGRVRSPQFNGKVERFFRTLRIFLRFKLLPITAVGIQKHLDSFTEWYNVERPHAALDGLTPDEAWEQFVPADPIPIRARDQLDPRIDVVRLKCRGDPCLPTVRIRWQLNQAA